METLIIAGFLFAALGNALLVFVHQFFLQAVEVKGLYHVTYREHKTGRVYRTEALSQARIFEAGWRWADRRFAEILAIETKVFIF